MQKIGEICCNRIKLWESVLMKATLLFLQVSKNGCEFPEGISQYGKFKWEFYMSHNDYAAATECGVGINTARSDSSGSVNLVPARATASILSSLMFGPIGFFPDR